jgi:hypothetical protein
MTVSQLITPRFSSLENVPPHSAEPSEQVAWLFAVSQLSLTIMCDLGLKVWLTLTRYSLLVPCLCE